MMPIHIQFSVDPVTAVGVVGALALCVIGLVLWLHFQWCTVGVSDSERDGG